MRGRLSIPRLAPRRPRLSWLSPALAPHQQLDAGIAARHQVDRKNLKKSKRPFDNYFRSAYPTSPRFRSGVSRSNGVASARDVSRLMTDARRGWAPCWTRLTRVRRRRDVRESPDAPFGADPTDRVVARLLALRFQWDRGDDVLAPSLVPPSLRALSEHSAPFAPSRAEAVPLRAVSCDGAFIPTHGRRRAASPPARWGWSGAETIPTLVLDAARGPLLSAPTESALTLRWTATNREAAGVSEAVRLWQSMRHVSSLGLPPRTLLRLLRAQAALEVADPAKEVDLAVAVGEAFLAFAFTERLEVLRCLRRVGLVRGVTRMAAAAPGGAVSMLYRHAARAQACLPEYIADTAPFLVDKVWAQLPEQTQRLARRGLFLDWTDLMALALELRGGRLPAGLPNPVTAVPYVAKFLFLRHTLRLDETLMQAYATSMMAAASSPSSSPIPTASTPSLAVCEGNHSMNCDVPGSRGCSEEGTLSALNDGKTMLSKEDESEAMVKPFVIWLCVAFLARLVADAIGDVLRHVESSMRRHVQLAKEYEAAAARGVQQLENLRAETDLQCYLDRIALARPARPSVFQRIGRHRPKRMRLRVIPVEAFPEIFRHARLPCEAEARLAAQRCASQEQKQQQQLSSSTPSALTIVLAQSAFASRHIRRACDALDWASMILTHCTAIVRHLPTPVKEAQCLTEAINPTSHGSPRNPTVTEAMLPEGEVMGNRFACCESFVRSRVQSDMDCLFLYLPWQGVEEQLQNITNDSSSVTEGKVKDESTLSEEVVEETVEVPHDLNACFLDELLTRGAIEDSNRKNEKTTGIDGSEGGVKTTRRCNNKAGDHVMDSSRGIATSVEEEETHAMLETLQESVERFQMTVADLIDAQEEFFLMV